MPRLGGNSRRSKSRQKHGGHRMHRRNALARRIARLGSGRKSAGWGRTGAH